MIGKLKGKKRTIKELEGEKQLFLLILNDAIQNIDRSRSENMEIRLRAERMAIAIEDNDWDLESAVRLANAVCCWREFQERSCNCPACEGNPVFAEEGDEIRGLD